MKIRKAGDWHLVLDLPCYLLGCKPDPVALNNTLYGNLYAHKFKFMRVFVFMKARLNLTIDETLLAHIKSYSESKKVSISKPTRHQNIIDMVEKLNPPKFDVNSDLKKEFYEEQGNKYAF